MLVGPTRCKHKCLNSPALAGRQLGGICSPRRVDLDCTPILRGRGEWREGGSGRVRGKVGVKGVEQGGVTPIDSINTSATGVKILDQPKMSLDHLTLS